MKNVTKTKEKTVRFPRALTDAMLAAACLYILWPGTAGYEHIQNAKATAFYAVFGGYLFLMMLFSGELVIAGQMYLPNPKQIWKESDWVQRLVVLFWLMTLISTLISPYRTLALVGMTRNEGLLTITIYCGCFLCVSRFAQPKLWLAWLFAGVMTMFCILCLLQLAGGNPLGLYPEGTDYFGANVDYAGAYLGTTGNADLTAALLTLSALLFAGLLLRIQEKTRWLFALPLILCCIVLWKAQIQAGLVGTILGLLLALPVLLTTRQKWRIVAYLLLSVMGVVALVILRYGSFRAEVFWQLHEILCGNWEDNFGSGRIFIWRSVLALVPQHLLFGTGPDTMAAAGISGYSYYNASLGKEIPYLVDTAHNEYLNILYHQGISALLSYLAALLLSAKHWMKSRCNGVRLLGCAILGYCIQAFFGFSMCSSTICFWLVWGLLIQQERENLA